MRPIMRRATRAFYYACTAYVPILDLQAQWGNPPRGNPRHLETFAHLDKLFSPAFNALRARGAQTWVPESQD